MVDTTDLKSVVSNGVPVRVRPAALFDGRGFNDIGEIVAKGRAALGDGDRSAAKTTALTAVSEGVFDEALCAILVIVAVFTAGHGGRLAAGLGRVVFCGSC